MNMGQLRQKVQQDFPQCETEVFSNAEAGWAFLGLSYQGRCVATFSDADAYGRFKEFLKSCQFPTEAEIDAMEADSLARFPSSH